jgi:hypothetical protein
VETPEYLGMVGRMIRSAGRRVGDADPEDLEQLLALRAQLDDAIRDAVATQRGVHGRSWADIARATGTTRQGAQQRWGRAADDASRREADRLAAMGQLELVEP